jgi:hypothetical protein
MSKESLKIKNIQFLKLVIFQLVMQSNFQKNKLRSYWHFLIILITIICSCSSNGLVEKSDQFAQIQFSEYLIENNTWNVKAAKSKWSESIYRDTLNGNFGWKWDFTGEKDEPNEIKSYPEVIYGRKPYSGYKSTTTLLPKELIKAGFWINYDYTIKADGAYNISTDISITDSKNPNESNIRAKIMIWFKHENIPFVEQKNLKKTVIDRRNYEIYIDTAHIGPEGKWVYIALMPDTFPSQGKLKLEEYFNYFISIGILKPDWFLSSIELGSEISSGRGNIVFKRFIVSMFP